MFPITESQPSDVAAMPEPAYTTFTVMFVAPDASHWQVDVTASSPMDAMRAVHYVYAPGRDSTSRSVVDHIVGCIQRNTLI